MLEDAKSKAAVLVEALPYIQRFQGSVVVIKLGGAALDLEADLGNVLLSVVFLSQVGLRPVLVHGGGPFISRAMSETGKKPVFVRGQRVTDEQTLQIVEDVLVGTVNPRLVAAIEGLGGRAAGLHTRHGQPLVGQKLAGQAEDGSPQDLGAVGQVVAVRTEVIHEAFQDGRVPVLAPLAVTREGAVLNCNADGVAWKVAAELRAEKLVVLCDVPGILRDPQDEGSLLSHVTQSEAERLEAEGVLSGGMLPKVDACVQAVAAGVRKAHMIDGRIPHALLLEVFTDKGVGTEIVRDGARPSETETS